MNADLEGAQLSIAEGKEGWLFLTHYEDTDVMRLHTDEQALDAKKLHQWARTLEYRQRWFHERRLPYFTLFVPETCVVYPDMLPDDIRLAPTTPFERLRRQLRSKTASNIIYPRQALIDGRSERETYQKVDSHWTDWGAYLAYRALIERVREKLPNTRLIKPEEINWQRRRVFGPLGALMTPERSCEMPVARLREPTAQAVESIATERRHNILTMVSSLAEGPTAIIFRDSFATAMAPFLSESFARTIYVSGHALFYDLVERLKPDVVIYERAERALLHPPTEPDANDARAYYDDLRLGSDEAISAQRRSRALLADGKSREALAMSDTALELAAPEAPGRARALAHRARIFRALGNPYAAAECLRHAMTLEPDGALSFAAAADVERALGHSERALALLRRATELEPTVPYYWETRAQALLQNNDAAGATQCLETALQLDSEQFRVHLLMSRAAAVQKDLVRARLHAERAVGLDGEAHYALSNLASVLIQQADWTAAREVLQRAVTRYPADTHLLQYLNLCDARLGEPQASRAETADT